MLHRNEKPSILLIANDPKIHQPILGILTRQGFPIGIATDGESGYQKAQLTLPGLILLDASIQTFTGLCLVHMLRGLPATSSIPIIYLAPSRSSQECISALQAGSVDYLSYPYQAEELAARIQIHLRHPSQAHATTHNRRMTDRLAARRRASGTEREDQMLIYAVDRAIRGGLKDSLTQKALADMLQVSERRLTSAFTRSAGIRLAEYIRQQRLKQAERLISTTTLSLATIAEELGFSSPANFSTAFKRHKGITPREFRNQPIPSPEPKDPAE